MPVIPHAPWWVVKVLQMGPVITVCTDMYLYKYIYLNKNYLKMLIGGPLAGGPNIGLNTLQIMFFEYSFQRNIYFIL